MPPRHFAQYAVEDKLAIEAADVAASEETPGKEDGGLRDVAADLFLEIRNYSPEELHSERLTVRRKLDSIIMPL